MRGSSQRGIQRLQAVAVRSSASSEDGGEQSLAGKFDTVLNVAANNQAELAEAIQTVIESYGRADDPSDEVIIQEMVVNPSMSGVLFTYDHTNSSPYFVINYDDMSGKTNTVTSGDGQHSNRTLFVSRNGIKHLKSELFPEVDERS